ncbi:MAG: ketoacyl-ACP synthase III [Deltaproteobacteria bacterium]|nr:ketoacyl-ACP synthase III [Deltaproteobacteria bacterium]MBW2019989.1 ketoacyl-ACP synthase III [Deltaproteobacteria bacterium]MBW2075050.1 ketoacyl-ACP synthase III [Deltaproteobacteria bacterium]RLB84031.1 MAG: 3-oxoacyl-ACP synthase [Deltaproteobacteria bacterium]
MIKGRIVGTGSTTPKRILTNKDLETIVDTTDEWITRRTGIKERRISSNGQGENTSDLATSASLKALEMAGVSADALDMIVMGTVTPDRQFPSAACLVQKALNASKAVAFDVSAGCSGFLYALSVATNAIATGNCKNALVIGAERLSTITNWEDRSTCVLLGDGAGAVVLTPTTEHDGILSTHLESDGSFWNLLYASNGTYKIPEILDTVEGKPFYVKMEGNRLFKKAVECLADIALVALEHHGLSSADITLMVPHQANLRIIRAAAERLSIPMDKVYTNLQKYGNTSSASIPIALDEANQEGLLKAGDYVLLVTFGAGLTWGASVVKWSV